MCGVLYGVVVCVCERGGSDALLPRALVHVRVVVCVVCVVCVCVVCVCVCVCS